MISKEDIVELLAKNDKAVVRAVVLLNDRQTSSEQSMEATVIQNNRGFRPCHAHMGTSMAKFFQRAGFLTAKQIAYWRVPDKNGNMRIAIYWRQLQEEAELKAKRQAVKEQGAEIEKILQADDEAMIEAMAIRAEEAQAIAA